MSQISPTYRVIAGILSMILFTGCSVAGKVPAISGQSSSEATSTEERSGVNSEFSHSDEAEPDYEAVFPQDAVNRIDITLLAEAWTDLQTEMTEQFGEFGVGGQGRGQAAGGIEDLDFDLLSRLKAEQADHIVILETGGIEGDCRQAHAFIRGAVVPLTAADAGIGELAFQ